MKRIQLRRREKVEAVRDDGPVELSRVEWDRLLNLVRDVANRAEQEWQRIPSIPNMSTYVQWNSIESKLTRLREEIVREIGE